MAWEPPGIEKAHSHTVGVRTWEIESRQQSSNGVAKGLFKFEDSIYGYLNVGGIAQLGH